MWELIQKDVKAHGKKILLVLIAAFFLVKCFGGACVTKLIIGLPCPACGMTRAAALFAQGRIIESVQMQPLFLLLMIGAVLFILLRYVLRRYEIVLDYYAGFLTIFAVAFYIYRMLRYFPDTVPMTYWEGNLYCNIGQVLNVLWEKMQRL